jgi:hypothetical protein
MAPNPDSETRTFTGQCYCKSVHVALELPTSALPLAAHICHCSVCRYTHGALAGFFAPLPRGLAPKFIAPSGFDKMTAYSFPGSTITRYFCSTCGCHIAADCPDNNMWVIATSIFAKDESVIQIMAHTLTDSAVGGGLDEWLPRIGDREIIVWNPEDGRAAPGESKVEFGPNGEDRLRAQCHCGGVSFTIPRPNKEVLNDPVMRKYVSPVDKSKWVATIDACDDCRLVTGSHVQVWTYIPLEMCEPKIKPDLAIGTNKTFVSSPGTLRSFCGICGATVFFSGDDRRPTDRQNIVNVAVGILRAPEGVKAEKWLTWRTGDIGGLSSGERYDEEFIKSLSEGAANWDKQTCA